MGADITARFAFEPGLRLDITAPGGILDEFRSEYGEPVTEPGAAAPDVAVSFVSRAADRLVGAEMARDGHKSVRWETALNDPSTDVLEARIRISGWPTSFARSLVQGYLVEPLLSVAAARRGLVLLPSAGIVGPDGLIVILGRSRAGKSTLAARSLALGFQVIGDDQVIVAADGSVWPFPRRLRFYPDLATVAPVAFRHLRAGTRRRLMVRGLISSLTRGYVRPSLAVDPAELGRTPSPSGTRPARLVILERADVERIQPAPATPEASLETAATLLAEQRRRLVLQGGPRWASAIAAAATREAATLRSAFDPIPCDRIVVPVSWPAARAVAEVAAALGLDARARSA